MAWRRGRGHRLQAARSPGSQRYGVNHKPRGTDAVVPAQSPLVVERGRRGETGSVRDKLFETIEVIRPALQADGGDIVVKEVNEETGVVSVELV
ncbi:MAG TPA: NifU family protein, partial [Acidimicrobiales bacterium]|nr:NifU family protein [Acidimicrobiales bacterium]